MAEGFENPVLILENQDGFDDLANNFNMRGVPHTLAQRTSIDSAQGPRTGWSGDGTLRSFATGAVIQYFPKTLARVPGIDFRLPSDEELDALEAFQLSLGRQNDLALPLSLKGVVASRGQEIFLDNALGKCNACHFNAGANGINLEGTQVVAVAAFLRVINALDNIRSAVALLEEGTRLKGELARGRLEVALAETEDAIAALAGGGLHPQAARNLTEAKRLTEKGARSFFFRVRLLRQAIKEQQKARAEITEAT